MGLEELRPRGDFCPQTVGAPVRVGIAWGVGGTDEECRRTGDLAPRRQHRIVAHRRRGGDEAAAVEIPNRLGVGLIAAGDVVAVQAQDIGDAERRGAQQIGLQRQSIAVAHGELKDRLDAVPRH